MKNKKIVLIIFLIFFGLVWFIIPSRAATKTKSYTPLEDTYTTDAYPTTPHGNSGYMYSGDYSGGDCSVYIQFELINLPSNIQSVDIRFEITFIENPMDLYYYKVGDVWFEEYLTHDNKPSRDANYGSLSYSSTGIKTATFPAYLDLTTEGLYFSIELYPTDHSDYYVEIATKENTGGYQVPTLLIEYTATEPFPVPLLVGIIVGVIAAIATAVIVTIILVKKKKKGRIEPIVEPEPKITKTEEQPIPREFFCFKCGAKVSGKFCEKCGTEVPHE